MTEMIKKDAQMSAKNHINYNSNYLTMQIASINSPLEERMLQRKIKRSKMVRRREMAKNIVSYSIGAMALLSLWIVMTGLYG